MSVKRNFAITVLDYEKINEINEIIVKNTKLVMQSSSHIYFDTQPVNQNEITQDITFFQIESEDKKGVKKKLESLIEQLDQVNTDYGLRDEDTGEMIVYVKFVGAINIGFDGFEVIKEGTYAKIDELKTFKSELGTCKGYVPNFRPRESKPIGNIKIKTEHIYLFCHTQEDLLKLKDILLEKVSEIDSDLKLGFRQFTEEDIEQ